MFRAAAKLLIERLAPKGEFGRAVSILGGGTLLGQGLAILASPLLTRMFSTAEFGTFQIYFSLITYAVILVSWRYEQAILLPPDDETAALLLVLTVSISVVTAILLTVIGVALNWLSLIPKVFNAAHSYLWVAPISACGAAVYQACANWALRSGEYRKISATKVSQVAGQVGVQLSCGFARVGAFGLIAGDAVGRMVGSFALGSIAWRQAKPMLVHTSVRQLLKTARRYRNFPMFSTGAALINMSAFALPTLLIANAFGTQVLGWYALVDRVLQVPSSIVGQAVAQVYTARSARDAYDDPQRLQQLYFRTFKQLLMWGALPCVFLFVAGPRLFSFVFGDSWRQAGEYARYLLPMHYIGFCISPLTLTLNVLERQHWQLFWDIGRLVLAVGTFEIARLSGWEPRYCILAYSLAMALAYLLHLLLSSAAIRIHLQEKSLPALT